MNQTNHNFDLKQKKNWKSNKMTKVRLCTLKKNGLELDKKNHSEIANKFHK